MGFVYCNLFIQSFLKGWTSLFFSRLVTFLYLKSFHKKKEMNRLEIVSRTSNNILYCTVILYHYGHPPQQLYEELFSTSFSSNLLCRIYLLLFVRTYFYLSELIFNCQTLFYLSKSIFICVLFVRIYFLKSL